MQTSWQGLSRTQYKVQHLQWAALKPLTITTTITTTVLRPFFWDHPGEPVPEQNFWTLWCKGRLTEADTLTIRLAPLDPD